MCVDALKTVVLICRFAERQDKTAGQDRMRNSFGTTRLRLSCEQEHKQTILTLQAWTPDQAKNSLCLRNQTVQDETDITHREMCYYDHIGDRQGFTESICNREIDSHERYAPKIYT